MFKLSDAVEDTAINNDGGTKASRYVSLVMAMLLGAAIGVGGLYPMLRDIKSSLKSYMAVTDERIGKHEKFIEQTRVKTIFPEANVRITVLELKQKSTEEELKEQKRLLVVLNDFRLEGGRYTKDEAEIAARDLRFKIDTLIKNIADVSSEGAQIEIRVERLERKAKNERTAKD